MEVICAIVIVPVAVLVIWLVIWSFGRCTNCNVKMKPHRQHPNMMVCPKCGRVEIHS